ncbi:carbohydrate porin [Pantoea sp. Acro-835]|uniref:Carbohydrate porin n=2 Tax=Candidatus Pantoea multigeneris TaxID=2608357 RepID=A0ABX0RC22_9GAMM|nr:carbohydrate porin [Pantoea multigeneris]
MYTMKTSSFKIKHLTVALLCALAVPAAQATDFFTQDSLTGDWGGARSDLVKSGVTLTGDYVSETAGILNGGQSYGTRYAQQIRLGATFDLNRLLDAENAGTIQLTINDRRGRSTSGDLVGNRLPIQEVYGGEYTRLSEFSYTNTLFTPQLQYKLGLLAMGNDFGGLSILTNFMNAGFCAHPLSMSGGSGWGNYPNAHLGGELKYTFNDSWALQTAVFNVNPQQNSESSRAWKPFAPGTTGYIVPVELIYNFHSDLPGQYKLGYYFDSSNVARIDQPNRRSNNRWGAYLLADQTIWQSDALRSQNLHIFGQATTTDKATSTFSHWYSAGFVLNGPFAARPNDAIAIGYGRAVYNSHSRENAVESLRAKGELADADLVGGLDIGEQLVEMTYTLQATPWLSVRPSVQYIKEPGAFYNKDIKDTWVAGVQVKVKF